MSEVAMVVSSPFHLTLVMNYSCKFLLEMALLKFELFRFKVLNNKVYRLSNCLK